MSQWDIYSNRADDAKFGQQESFDFSYNPNALEKAHGRTLDTVLPTQGWPKAELSEINSDNSESVLQLLLPTLAKLNAENRWISLISPPADINLQLFAHYGIDTSKVLLIHPKNEVDDKVTMNKALKNGTSGIVIFWATHVNRRYLAQWRKSVKQGDSTGIIVNMSHDASCSDSVALSFEVLTEETMLFVGNIRLFGVSDLKHEKISFCKKDLASVPSRFVSQRRALN